ncbi:MAG TPA: hemerythrin domain-containing protein [Bacillales bacterium]|nr:hemerythrin domain-containing protein [Bacillales bacterium]
MSGPALKKKDSHAAIHEAALDEARELTELLGKETEHSRDDRAVQIACVLVEHWETRTLAHAQTEEEGLYRELAKQSPKARRAVSELTRDHELMRRLLREIKAALTQKDDLKRIHARFQAMILVDEIHNDDEESLIAAKGR